MGILRRLEGAWEDFLAGEDAMGELGDGAVVKTQILQLIVFIQSR